MRLIQRLFLQSVVVMLVFGVAVLGAIEWRVQHRLELRKAAPAMNAGAADRELAEARSDDALLRAIRQDVIIATGAALMLALLLARMLSRQVTRPMEELRDMARDLAGGDLTARPRRP